MVSYAKMSKVKRNVYNVRQKKREHGKTISVRKLIKIN